MAQINMCDVCGAEIDNNDSRCTELIVRHFSRSDPWFDPPHALLICAACLPEGHGRRAPAEAVVDAFKKFLEAWR